jgi:hypothetical protein
LFLLESCDAIQALRRCINDEPIPDIAARAAMSDLHDMTKKLVVGEYVRFCVEHGMKTSVDAAQLFAVKVTESGGRKYHDMSSDDLVKMLGTGSL